MNRRSHKMRISVATAGAILALAAVLAVTAHSFSVLWSCGAWKKTHPSRPDRTETAER